MISKMMSKVRISPPFSKLREHEVFAVEADRAQLIVRAGSPTVAIQVAGQRIEANTTNDVAVISVTGLHSNTTYFAYLEDGAGRSIGKLSFTTRPALTGTTTKFATISDVHLGAEDFGGERSIKEPEDTDPPYPLRTGAAAIAEAIEWGAEALLIKGDLTDTGAESDWEHAHRLLDDVPIPVMATWGNHDVWGTREVDPQDVAGSFDLDGSPVVVADLPNVRMILADTSVPSRGWGNINQHRDAILEAARVDQPVFLGIHHNIMRTTIPWFYPMGIPAFNAAGLLKALPEANPNVFISAGHTHRNRWHRLGANRDIAFTEVAATADYPGVWAGYEVSADVIRQTVQRTASPEALRWSERCRAAINGVWPRWSQGRLSDRCVDLDLRER